MSKEVEAIEPVTKLCTNCERHIAESAFLLHEVHCKKNIVLCEHCREPVPKRELEEHFEEEHSPESCNLCGKSFPKDQLAAHKENSCPDYKVECKYCELEIRRADYQDHVNGCGSRTDFCELCNQRVMLKDMDEHKQIKCGHMKSEDRLDPTTLQYLQEEDEQRMFLRRHAGEQPNLHGLIGTSHLLQFGAMHHHHGQDHTELPPSYEHHREESFPVDPQWLESVAKACDNPDDVLAQNLMAEDYRHGKHPFSSVRVKSSEQSDEDMSARQYLADQRTRTSHEFPGYEPASSDYTRTSRDKNREMSEQSKKDMEESDAAMARMIHERDLSYAQQKKSKNSGEFGEASGGDRASVEENDEALAWRIHRSDLAYSQQDKNSGGRDSPEEERDAQLAREMYEKEKAYVENLERDKTLAQQLQDEENLKEAENSGGRFFSNGYSEKPESERSNYGDTELAQKLQLEEEARSSHFPVGGRSHEREAGYKSYGEEQKYDTELARKLQLEEEASSSHFPVGGRSREREAGYKSYGEEQRYDTRKLQLEEEASSSHFPVGGRFHERVAEKSRSKDYNEDPLSTAGDAELAQKLQMEEERRDRQQRQGDKYPDKNHHERSRFSARDQDQMDENWRKPDYNAAVLDNEQPRAKTPPPKEVPHKNEGEVPCQYCNKLFPFEGIMEHQELCTGGGYKKTSSVIGSHKDFVMSNPARNRTEKPIELTDEMLQKISSSYEGSWDLGLKNQTAVCKYCHVSVSRIRLQSHETLCDRNPDKDLLRRVRSRKQDYPSSAAASSYQSDSDDGKGPCEICGELIPVMNLVKHELSCKRNKDRKKVPKNSVPTSTPRGTASKSDVKTTTNTKSKLAIRFPQSEVGPTTNTDPLFSSFSLGRKRVSPDSSLDYEQNKQQKLAERPHRVSEKSKPRQRYSPVAGSHSQRDVLHSDYSRCPEHEITAVQDSSSLAKRTSVGNTVPSKAKTNGSSKKGGMNDSSSVQISFVERNMESLSIGNRSTGKKPPLDMTLEGSRVRLNPASGQARSSGSVGYEKPRLHAGRSGIEQDKTH